jgi:hypothetical protein
VGAEGLGDEEMPIRPRALVIDPETALFYLADERRIFVSADEGKSWARVEADLPPGEIYAIALAAHPSRVSQNGASPVWVGMERGLFLVPVPVSPHPGPLRTPNSPGPPGALAWAGELRTEDLPTEPTVQEVHQVAIRYAEVMPGKISGWRAGAMWRNLFPRFTVGLDRDRERTIASSTSGGKTTFTLGPEDESVSLDFGFTWDLANLVWNPDQTSIDTRSRLMVQLRQDILEEVTRVYFERRRLLAEFGANPTDDPVLQAERELRIEELTARLDGYTGGWFSKDMEG